MRDTMNQQDGFTALELVVVVISISIMTAVVLFMFNS